MTMCFELLQELGFSLSEGFFKFGFETQMLLDTLFRPIGSVMGWTLFSVNGKDVTFGKILVGLFILTLGILASKIIVRWLRMRVLTRFVENESAAHAIENITFYFLIVFFSLVSLQISNIPMDVFKYIGGAAALAVGFGAQKIVYNFISGIIILIEQPIRIGDYVRIGEVYGRIEDIGMRATRVNSFENKHLILPNSRMIEEDVENLTLNSRRIKVKISVGVRYGSDVETVKKILADAAKENVTTLKSREPIVLFENFGDSSLEFSLLFDIKLNNLLDERRITSSVREVIDAKFKENGIIIAFPQRDVHLHLPEELQKIVKKAS